VKISSWKFLIVSDPSGEIKQWFENVEIPVLHENVTCANSNISSFEDMDFLCVIALCDMLCIILCCLKRTFENFND